MENKNTENFRKLLSGEKSDFLDQVVDKEWQSFSARVVFRVLDFMGNSNPKVTQGHFAEMIGVSPQYVSKLLKGKENLTIETMYKIAKALNIQFIDLLKPQEEDSANETIDEIKPTHCTTILFGDTKGMSVYFQKNLFKQDLINIDETHYNDNLSYC